MPFSQVLRLKDHVLSRSSSANLHLFVAMILACLVTLHASASTRHFSCWLCAGGREVIKWHTRIFTLYRTWIAIKTLILLNFMCLPHSLLLFIRHHQIHHHTTQYRTMK